MSFDAQKVIDANAHISKLVTMLRAHINRSYPMVRTRGSQHREDDVLDELLPGPGTYVDIGAADPEECSNTWLLYCRGWRGLLIEPLFWYWPAILRKRRGDFLVESAVRKYTGKTILRVQGSVSSVMPHWIITDDTEMLIDCERADEILDQFPAIRDSCRFCNIDVEGAEQEVLESINWEKFKPEVLCIEYREFDPVKLGRDTSGQWLQIVIGQGYEEIKRTPLNMIFRLKSKAGAKPVMSEV